MANGDGVVYKGEEKKKADKAGRKKMIKIMVVFQPFSCFNFIYFYFI
jgi:hypothetical protein